MVSECDPRALVVTSLLPVSGTPFEDSTTDDGDVVDFYRAARRILPGTPIVLGCVRSRTSPYLEGALMQEGIDGIGVPLPSTLRSNQESVVRRACCSLIGSGTL